MNIYAEGVIKIVFLAGALFWVLHYVRHRAEVLSTRRSRELLAVIVLGILVWFNVGGFHTDGSFFHNWEQFHYFVGSKYYPELGHDGLYLAALAARQDHDPDFIPPERVRDLRTNRVSNYVQLRNHQKEVLSRFSEDRWKTFVEDVAEIRVHEDVYRDHGYNPPPTWTAVARVITASLPVRRWSRMALALIDVVLLGISLLVIIRVFGLEKAAFCTLLFGAAFLSRFYWSGGAFLRLDWFAGVVIGVSMLKAERPASAGAAFAYAVAVRLFPVLLLLGLGAWIVRSFKTGRSLYWLRRFASGYVLVTLLLLGGGTLTGRGIEAYHETADNLTRLYNTPGCNGVGLRTLFMTGLPNLRGDLVNPESLYDSDTDVDDYLRLRHERKFEFVLFSILLLTLVVFTSYHAPGPAEATIISIGAIFALINLFSYYWVLLCLMPLYQTHRGILCGLAGNLCMWVWSALAMGLIYIGLISYNGAIFFFPASFIVLLMILVWYFGVPLRWGARVSQLRPSQEKTAQQ